MSSKKEVLIGNRENKIKVKVATKPFELFKGLRFAKEGSMLLEFVYESRWGIDMLFCNYDLDLYFLDKEYKIIDKKEAKKSTLNPFTWKIYKGKKKYKYVLEIDKREKKEFEIGEILKVF